MSYADGFEGTVMGAGTADKWPGKRSMDAALAAKTSSRTGGANTNCILRGILPLKKTANGTVTLQINDYNGDAIPGLALEYSTDATSFMPEMVELNLRLYSGLGFIKDSNNMDFLITDEVLHSVVGVTQASQTH